MNKRVKAFTIMEVTISMLVAAIAIAITYTCYHIIAKSYLEFKTKQEKVIEISQFMRVLNKDMDQATLVLLVTDGLALKGDSSAINYTFMPDKVLRTSVSTDTFKVALMGLNRYFENKPLTEPNNVEELNRLDEISFTILSGQTEIPYHYFKLYSSQQLINLNLNASN